MIIRVIKLGWYPTVLQQITRPGTLIHYKLLTYLLTHAQIITVTSHGKALYAKLVSCAAQNNDGTTCSKHVSVAFDVT